MEPSSAPSSCEAKAAASSIPLTHASDAKPRTSTPLKGLAPVAWFQTKPEPMFPKVTEDSQRFRGMQEADVGQPPPPQSHNEAQEKEVFLCSHQLNHWEASDTTQHILSLLQMQTRWMRGKETNPTLQITACYEGLQEAGGRTDDSETRSLLYMLIHILKRIGERFRDPECEECPSPGRVKRM